MADENNLIEKAIKLARIELSSEEKDRILKDIKDIDKLFSNLDLCKIEDIKGAEICY